MKIIIQALDGPSAKRRTWLRPGEAVSFGYSSLADFSIPEDTGLAPVHFRVACKVDDCELLVVDNTRPTKLNQMEVASSTSLTDGDLIKAGSTTFQVQIEGFEPLTPDVKSSDQECLIPAPSDCTPTAYLPEVALPVAGRIRLPRQAKRHLSPDLSSHDFLMRLCQERIYFAAVDFLAHGLSRLSAVYWSCRSLRSMIDQPNPMESDCFEAIERWVKDPNPTHARAAGVAAEAANHRTPIGMLALATSWQGEIESCNTNETEDCGKSADHIHEANIRLLIAQSVMLAAVTIDRTRTEEHFQEIIRIGIEVSGGSLEPVDPIGVQSVPPT